MGTRKEALAKTTSALKELVSTLVGWPWIKRQPKQLNMFDKDYAEYVRTNEQRFSAWRQVMNDMSKRVAHAQDGVGEVRKLVEELRVEGVGHVWLSSSTSKKIEALEATVEDLSKRELIDGSQDSNHTPDYMGELRRMRGSNPNNDQGKLNRKRKKRLMEIAPPGMATHHIAWGMRGTTLSDIATYANWARGKKVFLPNQERSGPIAKWSAGKRSEMFRHMLDLKLVEVLDGKNYGPKRATFIGTLKKWKYSALTIEKISIRLFEKGIGKWVPKDIPTEESAPPQNADDEVFAQPELSQKELEQQAYESDDPDLAEELLTRAVELDDQANGVVTHLEEFKQPNTENPDYHVGSPGTDLGPDWSEKWHDKRGNREYS